MRQPRAAGVPASLLPSTSSPFRPSLPANGRNPARSPTPDASSRDDRLRILAPRRSGAPIGLFVSLLITYMSAVST
ncbi:hypothetical protein VPH35_035880 [Triticum aestivum]